MAVLNNLKKFPYQYEHWFETGLIITITSCLMALNGQIIRALLSVDPHNHFKTILLGLSLLGWIIMWVWSLILNHYYHHQKTFSKFTIFKKQHPSFKWQYYFFNGFLILNLIIIIIIPFIVLNN